ncbi:TauD/TfdA dioxygenase family protein [Gluconacetobacter sacchari]|uniref:TauD/TfdA family dioxygenase n=2 Tax=Gluconacetobacter sacchari TaxID=92759 RepID=A0A7W4IFT3_9PROT|nr:TauD/TfdA family dioxygenase [Gluconacetobacter sacchari]MBB2161974.1 TauD/TfdA family dioxygenase [Gluconacetobacter sacchari]GBQ18694.1 taurine dioxygenase [Gluconacetobacter sacchari DSM 12717]
MVDTTVDDTAFRTVPLDPKSGFGAEIIGLDLRKADEATVRRVVGIFHRHGALLLRGQSLDPAELVRFIRHVGTPEGHTLQDFTLPGFPEIYVLSNRVENGRPIGAHNDGVGWHTDYSYKAEPVMSTMLYAVEVPPEGSDTLIADGVAAYEALPPERRAQLEKLRLHHSYRHFMETREHQRRRLTPEQIRDNPDVVHPLVRVHPVDGRKALWPSTGTVTEIIGQDDPSDLSLLDELVAFMTRDPFVYRHQWQVGDLLMWDNRCTLHTGTLFDDRTYLRTMHRLWVKGDRPA